MTEPDTRPARERVADPLPTPTTLFLRGFIPWQLVRFVWINLKMLAMIRLAHPHRIPADPPE